MGAYKFDPVNPPVMEGGKRNPVKPSDKTCKCAALQLAPGFLRPLLRVILGGAAPAIVTERDLHPNVDRVVSALLDLKDTVAESRARNGAAVRISFSETRRVGDNFECNLAISLQGNTAFTGSLAITGVWQRGKVSFAHSVIGAIELLYLHLPEAAREKEAAVDLHIGVISLIGKAIDPTPLHDLTSNEIAAAIADQNNGGGGGPTCTPIGPFDPLAMYGAFPSSGYGYFHGPSAELREGKL